jgi:4-alpha-glucanotransferase
MTKGRTHPGREGLDALAMRCGVQRRYTDGAGTRRIAPDEAVVAVLRAMGLPIEQASDAPREIERLRQADESRLCEPVAVLWTGRRATVRLGGGVQRADAVRLVLERDPQDAADAGEQPSAAYEVIPRTFIRMGKEAVGAALPACPSPGVYRLTVEANGRCEQGIVLVAPPRCFEPIREPGQGPVLGAFLPLYAVRSDADLGVGHLGDLTRLGQWAADSGCGLLGTLPLMTTFLDEPFEPSPYVPVSRCVFSELFVDPHDAAERYGLQGLSAVLRDPGFQARAFTLRSKPLVDYRATWALVRRCLDAAASDVESSDALSAQVGAFAEADPLIADYARFRSEHAPAGRSAQQEARLFRTAQWLLAEQLDRASAAMGDDAGLYLDLPIGAHPEGFDAWRQPGLHAAGASLGAPPDGLFRHGQSWGFPPVIPEASRRIGHRAFADAIGRHLRYAAALRVDHAAGIYRCFWTPDGFGPTDGVYVKQPAEEYLAILSLLSHRHRATIVAENLGTVPRSITRGLERRALANMEIVQFSLGDPDDPLPRPAPKTLVSLNTHDMPTFAAHWSGDDIALNTRLGVVPEDEAPSQTDARGAMRQCVADALRAEGLIEGEEPDTEQVLDALLTRAADSEASILLVNLEDLWGETMPQNVPGVTEGIANWRRKSARTLTEITGNERIGASLRRLANRSHAGLED